MSFDGLLIHTVTVYPWSGGTEDRYGNATEGWGTGVQYPARVEQDTSAETLIDRDTRHSIYTVFLPPTAAVTALSKIDYGGRTLQVVGDPDEVADAIGVHHIEAVAEAFSG
jgi:head-tail adaptor